MAKLKSLASCRFITVAALTIASSLIIMNSYTAQFASLKTSNVNLRVGPGKEYPVCWVIGWHNVPIALAAEFKLWRKIRLHDGTEGWVHQNIISNKNTVIVTSDYAILYRFSSKTHPIYKIEKNVIARVLKKEEKWIKVEVNGIKGWLERQCIWGVDE
jgi:SH3-like domain-containing protein